MVPLNNSQFFLTSLNRLIESFRRLPGVGPKTAQRLAFYVLKMQEEDVREFSDSLTDLKSQIIYCDICQNISEKVTCEMCVDKSRDDSLVCVVEDPMDIYVLDKAGIYNGTFHVLHGSISPSRGVGPEELRIKQLIERIEKNTNIKEIIIATNLNLEGEATGMYLQQILAHTKIKITRLARGLPSGSDIEYADQTTISHALNSRVDINENIK